MARRLKEIEWGNGYKNGEPLHEVRLWGIYPLKFLAEIAEDEAEDLYDSEQPELTAKLAFACYEIQKLAEDLEETLDRLNDEAIEQAKRLV